MHVYAPPARSDQIYTTAFYFAIIAACLYFINTLILSINLLGYLLGHYPQHFALTDSQRTLILQTTAFGIWLIVGTVIFQKLIGISWADALYFSDITILTLGFGDITAKTAVARGIIFPYAVLGIIMLGLVIGSINRIFNEIEYHNVVRKRINRKRQAVVENSMYDVNIPLETLEVDYQPRHSRESHTVSSNTSFCHGLFSQQSATRQGRERFHAMRAIQNEVAKFHRWYSLFQSVIAFAIVWTCGALVFRSLQDDLTYFDALYFNFVCLLSVGYGDITPTTNSARAFFVLWSILAVPTMTTLISEMSDTIIAAFNRATNYLAGWSVLSNSKQTRTPLVRLPLIRTLLWPRKHKQDIARELPDEGGSTDNNSPSQPERSSSTTELKKEQKAPDLDVAYKLTFAIKRVTQDALPGKSHKYSYEEWAEFMHMIRLSHPRPDELTVDEDEYGVLNWDWIGEQTPMLSTQTEPEWILDRLCESMIRLVSLHGQRCFSRNEGQDEKLDEHTFTIEMDVDGLTANR